MAFCERLIGSARRECVDFMIPLNESHIRIILKPWVAHFNEGRPHSSLRPGIPEPSFPKVPLQTRRHHIPITIACFGKNHGLKNSVCHICGAQSLSSMHAFTLSITTRFGHP